MLTKLYKWDYEKLKNLPEHWEVNADYETLLDVAKILHEYNWFKSASDVFKFFAKPDRVVATYERKPFTLIDAVNEIIKEYEEEVAYQKEKATSEIK